MKTHIILIAAVVGFSVTSLAQNDKTIEGQFQTIFKEATNYQTYKVVKKENLERLQVNVHDTIVKLKTTIKDVEKDILAQKTSVDSLTLELESTKQELVNATHREDSMEFLGISFAKGSYQAIVWAIIAALLFSVIIFFYRFKKSHVDTKEAIKRQDELEKELEDLRKHSLEREQKIRRQLQDEINKNRKNNTPS